MNVLMCLRVAVVYQSAPPTWLMGIFVKLLDHCLMAIRIGIYAIVTVILTKVIPISMTCSNAIGILQVFTFHASFF